MSNEIDQLFEEGVELYEQGNMDEAETKFLEALKFDPESDEIKYNLALVYFEKKEYDKTNFLISQIKEIDCEEILDELEKVDHEFTNDNPFLETDKIKSESFNQQIQYFQDQLNEDVLPQTIFCDSCNAQINLSELERQQKNYTCSKCKVQNNIKEKERALENEFREKPDSELFEMLIDADSFRFEFVFAAKKEIKHRNLNLQDNEDFARVLRELY